MRATCLIIWRISYGHTASRFARCFLVVDEEYERWHSAQINSNMPIHIGHLIRSELRRQGHTNEWLAKRIHVHPRTIQKIFLKSTIDTQQLFLISQALGIDFFQFFSAKLSGTPDVGTAPK